MEGTCAVRGTVSIRGGEVIAVDGKGFRDIAVGPRNWDFIKHYRLAWPIFDNGLSIVATHGMSIDGQHAYIRMIGRDGGWTPVADIVDRNIYEDDGMTLTRMEWVSSDAPPVGQEGVMPCQCGWRAHDEKHTQG